MLFRRKNRRLVSRADVVTGSPERYAKQLVSHLGRKAPVTDTEDGSVLTIGEGRGTVRARDGVLELVAEAPGEESLAHVQDVLGRHLVRFGARDELAVTWTPPTPA